MLDMGFYDDLMKIINAMPKERQNLLFSATMPPQIRKLANRMLVNPVEINIAISKPPDQIVQGAFVVFETQKPALAKHILSQKEFGSVLVFCSSKQSVKQLTAELKREKLSVNQIHSDLEQNEREQVMLDFKSKKLKILVATDIISRGIDIEDIDLVINYDVPHDGEDYVHRIGRTARAATTGTAYTFVTEKELRRFAQIEKLLGKEVPRMQVPAELGPVPSGIPTAGADRRKTGGGKKRNFRKK